MSRLTYIGVMGAVGIAVAAGMLVKTPGQAEPLSIPAPDMRIPWNGITKDLIRSVNRQANRIVDQSKSDQEIYGMGEYFTDACLARRGDCEDIALCKFNLLSHMGLCDFGQCAIYTVQRSDFEPGTDHAILAVMTTKGVMVLDNLTDDVLPWSHTGYRFSEGVIELDPADVMKLKLADNIDPFGLRGE